ncbi:MAG TPA: PDZ domain-containing protein, partial [Pirellulales bacterium]
ISSITVERAGEEEPRELTLALSGDPVRLGISWRTDEAEPGVAIVNRVVAGSLAERAGLHVNDRIDRVSGRLFTSGEEFRKLLNDPAENLVLDVEAEGRVRAVEVPIGPAQ